MKHTAQKSQNQQAAATSALSHLLNLIKASTKTSQLHQKRQNGQSENQHQNRMSTYLTHSVFSASKTNFRLLQTSQPGDLTKSQLLWAKSKSRSTKLRVNSRMWSVFWRNSASTARTCWTCFKTTTKASRNWSRNSLKKLKTLRLGSQSALRRLMV